MVGGQVAILRTLCSAPEHMAILCSRILQEIQNKDFLKSEFQYGTSKSASCLNSGMGKKQSCWGVLLPAKFTTVWFRCKMHIWLSSTIKEPWKMAKKKLRRLILFFPSRGSTEMKAVFTHIVLSILAPTIFPLPPALFLLCLQLISKQVLSSSLKQDCH